ncbi:putative Glutamate receptor-like 81 [Homarus americanus]|uniref:Putative Glutamate receptor-like 81 n=1 Tax=Homarus americanus TaxID=6706 RepID=A0A8J5N6T3_HOMAM|nr:putative Glutamate receptor-like 81 [Homarus americanus]
MERRRTTKPTALAERNGFVKLWKEGKSLHAIARETGVSVTTVFRWINRWLREGNVNVKPRGNRPRSSQAEGHSAISNDIFFHPTPPEDNSHIQKSHHEELEKYPPQHFLNFLEREACHSQYAYMNYLKLHIQLHNLRSEIEHINYFVMNCNANLINENLLARMNNVCVPDVGGSEGDVKPPEESIESYSHTREEIQNSASIVPQ